MRVCGPPLFGGGRGGPHTLVMTTGYLSLVTLAAYSLSMFTSSVQRIFIR
jgi:biotin transporter BioY